MLFLGPSLSEEVAFGMRDLEPQHLNLPTGSAICEMGSPHFLIYKWRE